MFRSTAIRLCVLSLLMVIVTAEQRNCGRMDNQPCPEGQFCAAPGVGINGIKGQWKCYACPCRKASQCYFDTARKIKCDCETEPGWTGENCDIDIDECGTNPCKNGATCINGQNEYTCTCQPGWTGTDCDVDINECDTNPCKNGATCINGQNEYTCTCQPGWTGTDCDVDIDECETNPCKNGATCINGQNEYTCTCQPDWTGKNCDIVRCGTLPDFCPHVDVSSYDGNDTAGSSFTYSCIPCTWVVDINAASTISCQEDRTWSTPTCVFGADVGYIADGTPVPADAKGCESCPGSKVLDGFKIDGSFGCYCDTVCCSFGDCCYNFNCETDNNDDYYYNYYYNY